MSDTTYHYTGQRQEANLGGADGLYYYNSRWYDSYITQFTQPDSIIPDPYNPLDWNRYSYSRNNPVNKNDPTGHCVPPFLVVCVVLGGAAIGAVASLGGYVLGSVVTGHEMTWSEAGGAAVAGAVVGGIGVVSAPIAGSLLGAMGLTATNTAVFWGSVAVNSVAGGMAYLAGGATQNGLDAAQGKEATFSFNAPDLAKNVILSGALSSLSYFEFPVPNNGIRTLNQAQIFLPRGYFSTNAINLYSQVFYATGYGTMLSTGDINSPSNSSSIVQNTTNNNVSYPQTYGGGGSRTPAMIN